MVNDQLKTWRLTASIALAVGALTCAPAKAQETAALVAGDASLISCIAGTVGKATNLLTAADIAALTSLDCPRYGIRSLSALSTATRLQYINVLGNSISELSPLAGLASLKHINASDNTISSLDAFLLARRSAVELDANLNCVPGLAGIRDRAASSGIVINGAHQQYSSCSTRGAAVQMFDAYVTSASLSHTVRVRTSVAPGAACAVDWRDGSQTPFPCDGRLRYFTHAYASSGPKTASVVVNATAIATKAFNTAPVVSAATMTPLVIRGEAPTGRVTVADAEGDRIVNFRAHYSREAGGSTCWVDIGVPYNQTQAPGPRIFTGCSALSSATGPVYVKFEARDTLGSQAAVVRTQYTVVSTLITSLSARQTAAGGPVTGSMLVRGEAPSTLRVLVGPTAADPYCQTDIAPRAGLVTFSFDGRWSDSGGRLCNALLPQAGKSRQLVFKVEARDAAGALSNGGSAPTVATTYVAAAPGITVSGLTAAQPSAGQAINGSFSVSGSSVSLVRVHAGVSAADAYCYTDLAASTGAKSFSFSGAWVNQNGRTCSALLPAAGSSRTIVFKVEARDSAGALANAGTPRSVSANYVSASLPIAVSGLTAAQPSAGQAINGSFSVSGSSVSLVRVHAGVSAADAYCYTDLAASTGAKSFSFSGAWVNQNGRTCSALLPAAGSSRTIVFKVEARDSAGSLANAGTPPSVSANYMSASLPITVSGLTAAQPSAGQAINGSFSVAGSSVSMVRVHAGVSADDAYCYTDLAASTGAKSFSFSGAWVNQNGRTCSALLPAAGSSRTIVFKVEARDSAGALANAGTPPSVSANYVSASLPITVSGLTAAQPSAGQAINGSFSVAGSSVSLVRVHAGVSATDAYCYTDLAASTGAKSFSFSGAWVNQNGRTCSALLPAAGSSRTIVFKVEARDSAGALANAGTPPSVSANYVSASLPITVSGLTAAQPSAGQAINGSFSVSGSSVSMVRVHAGVSATDAYCYTDLAASTGAKSFSFSGAWVNQNGRTCSALLPAAGSSRTIVFKVEARDSAGALANAGTPPSVSALFVRSAPSVSSVSPLSFTRAANTTITVTGVELPTTALLTIADANCGSAYGHSGVQFQQICAPQLAGTKLLTVKDRSGGNVLYQVSVTVN